MEQKFNVSGIKSSKAVFYVIVKDRCGSDYHIETFESKARECSYVIVTDTEVSLTNLKTFCSSQIITCDHE